MKKLLSLIVAIFLTVSLVACNSNNVDVTKDSDSKQETKSEKDTVDKESTKKLNLEDAVWEGYEDLPFVEYLDIGLGKLLPAFGHEYEIFYKEGWIYSMESAEDVDLDGSKPCTYAYVTKSNDTAFTTYFHMKLDEGNVLSLCGVTRQSIAGYDDAVEFLELLSSQEIDTESKKNNPKKSNLEKAVWENYENLPFVDFLDEGLGQQSSIREYEISYEEGWTYLEGYDDADLDGASPCTYACYIESMDSTFTVYFYMKLDKEGILSLHDSVDIVEMNSDEVEEFLERFEELVEDDSEGSDDENEKAEDNPWEDFEKKLDYDPSYDDGDPSDDIDGYDIDGFAHNFDEKGNYIEK